MLRTMFDPVDPKQSFPDLERGILRYWQEEDIFKRSVKQRSEGESIWDQKRVKEEKTFSFYDGPPFATGLPHYGHLLAGTIKDVIPRYQTMRGKKVQRRFGWDCHGLPVENLVEKEEGIKSKKEIEEKGIRWFNDKCRASVLRYTSEWRKTVERTGRWVDMDWDYRTMDPDYMESIWWVFKSIYDKGLVYEGHKPMHICPRCVTPLSNFEVTQGYKDVTDVSVTVKFEILQPESEKDLQQSIAYNPNGKTYMLAWTTTPWTLPGNLFLAVGQSTRYVKVEYEGDHYILAKKTLDDVFIGKEYNTVSEYRGGSEGLVGLRFRPLFPYYEEEYKKQNAFRVVLGDFVDTNEGTGIVHIAPGFGEDDCCIGKNENVTQLCHVHMNGCFCDEVTDFSGEEVKSIEDPTKTDRKVVAWLKKHDLLFSSQNYKHSYPHCWRCDSPLLNYATSSWFVAVEKIKKDMLKSNAQTEWVPAHIRDGRFGEWLKNARDWAISRNRYWGTPLPIWRCEETDDIVVIGSRDELMSKCPIRFTKITVLRHAESEGNLIPIYQGEVPGTDLTKRGRGQAKDTGKHLKSDSSISVIYCSPLARTQQTAEIIAKKIGAKVIVDERLREVSFGEYEGRKVDFSDLTFIKERRAHKIERGKPESIYHFDGMETWESVQDRIQDFMDEIIPKHRGEHIAVVSHADPVINIKHFFTGEDPVKLSHQPYPEKAQPHSYFWDHDREAQLDLHKDTVDDVTWDDEKSDNSVQVIFVRHGQTDWNKDGKIQGSQDTKLNDYGRCQAKELAKKLSKEKFDFIVSSNLQRSIETAQILSKNLNIPFEEQLSDLRERSFGDFEGKTRDEVDKNIKGQFSVQNIMYPNGETFNQFFARMRSSKQKLLEIYSGKRILVVVHGGVLRAMEVISGLKSLADAQSSFAENVEMVSVNIHPQYRRIPDVLDCWFESGSMPYAQNYFPFEYGVVGARCNAPLQQIPQGFPADFIAEGLDQTRGWFYTLMVLSSALFKKPAFQNCIVNGIVLAEDGKKMSKRLKNYPEPDIVMEKFGADAMRFTLMASQAVRGESLRFSEKSVEETVRRVILPLWNTYSFFVLHANNAEFGSVLCHGEPCRTMSQCVSSLERPRDDTHPLDQWIKAELQSLTNRMTAELDKYDLSATCNELYETLDVLTNWYIRRSRRRFAGKEGDEARTAALATLNDTLLTFCKLLAPICPFITEAIYLNLISEEHHSIHLTDWPETRELTSDEQESVRRTQLLRAIASLGMGLRAEANVKVRQPLGRMDVALSESGIRNQESGILLMEEKVLCEELNVKEIKVLEDMSHIADRIVQVDARAVGPRLGKKVQEIICAGKEGNFTENFDGTITILDEILNSNEATVIYRGREGCPVASEKGIVVCLDTEVTAELKLEGLARDVIRSVQSLRKDKGLTVSDGIVLITGDGMKEILEKHQEMIEKETNGKFEKIKEDVITITISIDGEKVIVE